MDQPRQPKGRPDGGQYASNGGGSNNNGLPPVMAGALPPDNDNGGGSNRLPKGTPMGGKHMSRSMVPAPEPIFEDEDSTRQILDEADTIQFTPDGVTAMRDGHILFQENEGHRLNADTLKGSPKVRHAANKALRTEHPQPGEKVRDARRLIHAAARYADSHARHDAIWGNRNARFMDPRTIVRSFNATRDQDKAVDRWFQIYHMDASAAQGVVFNGWPKAVRDKNDPAYHTQWKLINGFNDLTARHGLMPEDRTRILAARQYLRERIGKGNGYPEPEETGRMVRKLRENKGDPGTQSGMVLDAMYGTGSPDPRNARTKFQRTYDKYTSGDGNGHMALQMIYSGTLSKEAAQRIVDAVRTPGTADDRRIHSQYRKQWGKARLTSALAYLHSRYGV